MEYISLVDATQRYNKSLSTIRKIINQTGSKYTKKGKLLNTGKHKVLISVDFLNTYFGTHSEHTENIELNKESEHIKSLKNQIENQQKTIDKLLDTQQESLRRQQEQLHLLNDAMRRENLLLEHFNRNKDLNQEHKTDEDFINESDIQEVFEEQPKQDEPINIDSYEDFTTWLKSMNG